MTDIYWIENFFFSCRFSISWCIWCAICNVSLNILWNKADSNDIVIDFCEFIWTSFHSHFMFVRQRAHSLSLFFSLFLVHCIQNHRILEQMYKSSEIWIFFTRCSYFGVKVCSHAGSRRIPEFRILLYSIIYMRKYYHFHILKGIHDWMKMFTKKSYCHSIERFVCLWNSRIVPWNVFFIFISFDISTFYYYCDFILLVDSLLRFSVVSFFFPVYKDTSYYIGLLSLRTNVAVYVAYTLLFAPLVFRFSFDPSAFRLFFLCVMCVLMRDSSRYHNFIWSPFQ